MRISSVRIETAGAHDHVSVWVDGACAGTLTVNEGDGEELKRLLLAGAAPLAPALRPAAVPSEAALRPLFDEIRWVPLDECQLTDGDVVDVSAAGDVYVATAQKEAWGGFSFIDADGEMVGFVTHVRRRPTAPGPASAESLLKGVLWEMVTRGTPAHIPQIGQAHWDAARRPTSQAHVEAHRKEALEGLAAHLAQAVEGFGLLGIQHPWAEVATTLDHLAALGIPGDETRQLLAKAKRLYAAAMVCDGPDDVGGEGEGGPLVLFTERVPSGFFDRPGRGIDGLLEDIAKLPTLHPELASPADVKPPADPSKAGREA